MINKIIYTIVFLTVLNLAWKSPGIRKHIDPYLEPIFAKVDATFSTKAQKFSTRASFDVLSSLGRSWEAMSEDEKDFVLEFIDSHQAVYDFYQNHCKNSRYHDLISNHSLDLLCADLGKNIGRLVVKEK